MKHLYFIFTVLLTVSLFTATAQQSGNAGTRAKAAIQLTKILNDAATAFPPQLSYQTEASAVIEKPFSISPEGILSVTFRYPVEKSFMLYKLTAPVSAIKGVFYDYYIGLEFDGAVVQISESEKGSRELKEDNILALFHVAKPGDGPAGESLKVKMQKGLETFRENYK
ncbi:hypothetical protein CLV51_104340 [Chitinophaga niastensis]|uniref:DUF4468 domain-containing protein n=1 Tax=Chitinophaga niastensis TaxID=536980 RepID=A0A2P8HHC5_CHINA|nr:hypothetical protein [Chitinophaga niastensis]PSL45634.1 hypothetical protein CLV51_104340 [Chitinophaga niastensis]